MYPKAHSNFSGPCITKVQPAGFTPRAEERNLNRTGSTAGTALLGGAATGGLMFDGATIIIIILVIILLRSVP